MQFWSLPVVCGLIFGLIMVLVAHGGPLGRFDRFVWQWTAVHRSARTGRLADAVVNLGSPPLASVALLVLGAALSARRRSPLPLLTAIAAVGVLVTVVLSVKSLIGRAGPGFLAPDPGWTAAVPGPAAPATQPTPPGWPLTFLEGLDRWAFPSGHTTTAVVTWTVGAALIGGRRLGRWSLAVVSTVALLVGGGLIWAGYHWTSDVLAAYALGTALSWGLLRAFVPVREPPPDRAPADTGYRIDACAVTTRSRGRG